MHTGLLSGIHHVATITRDMDRLVAFYGGVFDAHPIFDLIAPGIDLRHVGIDLGQGFLHAWEVPEEQTGTFPQDMFRRGRTDHFALCAPNEEALETLRSRLVDADACDGSITDFGSVLSVWFTDPDGMELEVCCFRTGVAPQGVRDPIIQPAESEEVS